MKFKVGDKVRMREGHEENVYHKLRRGVWKVRRVNVFGEDCIEVYSDNDPGGDYLVVGRYMELVPTPEIIIRDTWEEK